MVEILIAVLCWSWYAFRKAHCLRWFSCYPQKHPIVPITASIRYFFGLHTSLGRTLSGPSSNKVPGKLHVQRLSCAEPPNIG